MTDTAVPTPQQVLALPMQANDAGASTIRDYLIALLAALWDEKDGFDGKRPFGNSDWDGELVVALIRADAIEGELDDDGYIDSCDDDAAEELIAAAIQQLGAGTGSGTVIQYRTRHDGAPLWGDWIDAEPEARLIFNNCIQVRNRP